MGPAPQIMIVVFIVRWHTMGLDGDSSTRESSETKTFDILICSGNSFLHWLQHHTSTISATAKAVGADLFKINMLLHTVTVYYEDFKKGNMFCTC